VLRYAIAFTELNRVLGHFSRVFDVRTTFFDADGHELAGLDVKAMSGLCRRRRRDPAFDARCVSCDRQHIEEARGTGESLVYRCHAGLIEAVVPLRDEAGGFLGALVFGQIRPRGGRGRRLPAALRRPFLDLPESTEARVGDVAQLLQYVSEHIIRSQLVRRRSPDWADRLDRYIDEHIGERLTLAGLARAIHVSPSFLSHRAAGELGRPPLEHVAEKRLQLARRRLRGGATVREVAADLGFYDAFHLSRRFKARFGCPPTRDVSFAATTRP
jgi:AraC-like DNA-binding protein/ligand-binding sensor protein